MSGASYCELLATSRDKIYLYHWSLQYLMWRILIGSDINTPAEVEISEEDSHCSHGDVAKSLSVLLKQSTFIKSGCIT